MRAVPSPTHIFFTTNFNYYFYVWRRKEQLWALKDVKAGKLASIFNNLIELQKEYTNKC
jgi:hypothetical protein